MVNVMLNTADRSCMGAVSFLFLECLVFDAV